jgi:hypothetical protein
MNIESKDLYLRKMPWHSNFTDKNALGRNLMIEPAMFEGIMTQIFTAKNYSDNPLTLMMNKFGSKREIDQTEWTWKLEGANTRPLRVMENMESGNNTPGKYKTNFKVKLDEPWWLQGDVIHPGNPEYQCRVQEVLGNQGNGYVYVLRLMSDNDNAYVLPEYLNPGAKWGKLYSQYSEASSLDGSTQYPSSIMLKSRMSRYRKMYKVTGDAANEVLAVKIMYEGKAYLSWIHYAEAKYWSDFYRELERGAWYSRSTDTVLDDSTGRPVRSGPGVQELLKNSHVFKYSVLSVDLIQQYLMDIFYGRIKPGSQRNVKAFTGEAGMLLFHEAVQQWSEKSGFIKMVDSFTRDTKSEYSNRAKEAGYMYVKYNLSNGGSLELIHNPLYDDRTINFDLDPVTGFPKESMRFTFLDFENGGDGSTNIEWIDKKNGFKVGYMAGLHNPFGPTNKTIMSHSGDWYSMHCQKQFGIHIQDVTKCGELILSR